MLETLVGLMFQLTLLEEKRPFISSAIHCHGQATDTISLNSLEPELQTPDDQDILFIACQNATRNSAMSTGKDQP